MATYKELAENIGKKVAINVPTDGKGAFITINASIIDCRVIYGRTDYQVDFNGQRVWFGSDRIQFDLTKDQEPFIKYFALKIANKG